MQNQATGLKITIPLMKEKKLNSSPKVLELMRLLINWFTSQAIDLITNQTSITDSGAYLLLHPNCQHKIIFGKHTQHSLSLHVSVSCGITFL